MPKKICRCRQGDIEAGDSLRKNVKEIFAFEDEE